MKHRIDLKIRAPFRTLVRGAISQAARMALRDPKAPVELAVAVVGDAEMRRLNRTHRGVDETTDVLAFALREGPQGFVSPPDGVLHLGQVVISYPQAERQAREAGHSAEREIRLLVVHGVLHLLGYDHQETAGESVMRAQEQELAAQMEEVHSYD